MGLLLGESSDEEGGSAEKALGGGVTDLDLFSPIERSSIGGKSCVGDPLSDDLSDDTEEFGDAEELLSM